MADPTRKRRHRAAHALLRLLTVGALVALAVPAAAAGPAPATNLVTSPDSLVDTFIGTGSNSDFSAGNTFPGRGCAPRHAAVEP